MVKVFIPPLLREPVAAEIGELMKEWKAGK